MKLHLILIAILLFTGCRRARVPEPQTDGTSLGPHLQSATSGPTPFKANELKSRNDTYDNAVVIKKTGEKVPGYILLRCPGYFRVCTAPDWDGPLVGACPKRYLDAIEHSTKFNILKKLHNHCLPAISVSVWIVASNAIYTV